MYGQVVQLFQGYNFDSIHFFTKVLHIPCTEAFLKSMFFSSTFVNHSFKGLHYIFRGYNVLETCSGHSGLQLLTWAFFHQNASVIVYGAVFECEYENYVLHLHIHLSLF